MKAIRLTWLGKRKLSQQNKNNYKTLLLTTEYQRLFVFQVTASLYFQENVCQGPLRKQPQFTSESAASLAYNSDYSTHTAQAAITCPTQQEGWCILSASPGIVKRWILKGWDLIKSIIFPTLSRTFSNRTGFAFKLPTRLSGEHHREHSPQSPPWEECHTLWALLPLDLTDVTVKGSDIVMRKGVLTSQSPCKGFKEPSLTRLHYENYWATSTQNSVTPSSKWNTTQTKVTDTAWDSITWKHKTRQNHAPLFTGVHSR